MPRTGDTDFTEARLAARADDELADGVGAWRAIGVQLRSFLPDAAARITAQCTPRDSRLPDPSPIFSRLGAGNS